MRTSLAISCNIELSIDPRFSSAFVCSDNWLVVVHAVHAKLRESKCTQRQISEMKTKLCFANNLGPILQFSSNVMKTKKVLAGSSCML